MENVNNHSFCSQSDESTLLKLTVAFDFVVFTIFIHLFCQAFGFYVSMELAVRGV